MVSFELMNMNIPPLVFHIFLKSLKEVEVVMNIYFLKRFTFSILKY